MSLNLLQPSNRDRYALTRAHINRKHEPMKMWKRRKRDSTSERRFLISHTVSTYKIKLCGRNIFQSMEELQNNDHVIDYNHMKIFMRGPTVTMSFCDKHVRDMTIIFG